MKNKKQYKVGDVIKLTDEQLLRFRTLRIFEEGIRNMLAHLLKVTDKGYENKEVIDLYMGLAEEAAKIESPWSYIGSEFGLSGEGLEYVFSDMNKVIRIINNPSSAVRRE